MRFPPSISVFCHGSHSFSTFTRVFLTYSVGENVSHMLCGFHGEKALLSNSLVLALMLRMAWLETTRAMMIVTSLPSHFWAEAASISTRLINIQSSTVLQGGIPLTCLSSRSPDYSTLCLLVGCACYDFQCWDPVGCRVHISRDVTFGVPSFYPRPSSSNSSMEDISFLMFHDTSPSMPRVPTPLSPPLPIPHHLHLHVSLLLCRSTIHLLS
jgi:hypothetical protein